MNAPYPASDFARLVDVVAPGRNDIVAVIEAYFDESYDDKLLCVAGYAFKKTKVKALDKEWRHMLRRYKNLPFFRMSACAHRNEPFDRLSRRECDAIAREAIGLIREYAARGFAVTVDEKAFEAKVPTEVQNVHGGAYEFCAWNCLMGVRAWLDTMDSQAGVAYMFEAGHKHQPKASGLMWRLTSEPELRRVYRYRSHSFVLKEASRPCQAADLFAWQWFQHAKRLIAGKLPRKDGAALMHDRWYQVRHIDVDRHVEVVKKLMRDHPLEFLGKQPS